MIDLAAKNWQSSAMFRLRYVPIAFLLTCCTHRATPAPTPAPAPEPTIHRPPVVSAPAATASPPRWALVVHVIPIGDISDDTVQEAARGLESHAPVTVVVEDRRPLLPSLEASIKGRFRAERILEWMEGLEVGAGKLLGVTAVDIVAQKGSNENWGVLGLGTLDGRCSVLSTFRMERRWEKGGAPEALVRERLWKTAVHELGHTLGLPHCPNRGCIMEDAHGTVRTTDREKELCPDCALRFQRAAGI
jgi:archaemetzincin